MTEALPGHNLYYFTISSIGTVVYVFVLRKYSKTNLC